VSIPSTAIIVMEGVVMDVIYERCCGLLRRVGAHSILRKGAEDREEETSEIND
jgi:hypothetical protein